jgi:hypothetical protein
MPPRPSAPISASNSTRNGARRLPVHRQRARPAPARRHGPCRRSPAPLPSVRNPCPHSRPAAPVMQPPLPASSRIIDAPFIAIIRSRRIGVARGDGRHDRRVDHPQAHRDHAPSAARRQPPTGPTKAPSSPCPPGGRWWCRYRRRPWPAPASSSPTGSGPGRIFLRAIAGQAGWAIRRRVQADGIGGHLPVGFGGEVVGRNDGRHRGSGLSMRTSPREVGLRLQALTVMAGKVCNGSPNLSSDSGWT